MHSLGVPGAAISTQSPGQSYAPSDPLHTLLAECVRGKGPEDRVFTRANGRPVKDFRRAWLKLCTAASLPKLPVHDLRRSAARSYRRAGVAESVINEDWRLEDTDNVRALQHHGQQGRARGRRTQGTETDF